MVESPTPRPRFRWPGGWWRSLISILLGNAIYFGVVDYLPDGARHKPFELDWGLAIDFWLCVAIYGLSVLIWPRREK